MFFLLLFDLERHVSFAYVPVKDQNHVVRGKKTDGFVLYFLLIFEKVFKRKEPNGKNITCLVFFIFKRKDSNMIKNNLRFY